MIINGVTIKGEIFAQQFIPKLLDRTKTRTSRPMKPQPAMPDLSFAENREDIDQAKLAAYKLRISQSIKERAERDYRPKYQPGDVMYVRETWGTCNNGHDYIYRADSSKRGSVAYYNEYAKLNGGWHPSIHMPFEAARIFLRVVDVLVQRIDDVTEQDAVQDGFVNDYKTNNPENPLGEYKPARMKYQEFWNRQYGPSSPWMWVYGLKPITKIEALGGAKNENS